MDSKDELAKNLLIASNSIKNLPSLEEQETLYQQLLHLLVRKCNNSNIYELEEQVSRLKDKSIRQSPYSVPLLSLIIAMSPFTKTVIKFNRKFRDCLDGIPLPKYLSLSRIYSSFFMFMSYKKHPWKYRLTLNTCNSVLNMTGKFLREYCEQQ